MDDTEDPGAPGSRPGPDEAPPGLRAEIRAVRDAIRRLLTAHVDLAKAELSEIGAEIGRVAKLGGLAIAAVLLLLLFLPIGLALFLGELVFGSIGWGVLLGSLVLVDVAVVAILVALAVPGRRIGEALLWAAVIGLLFLIPPIPLHGGWRVWSALGATALLIAWPAIAGYRVAREGIDTEGLKARFTPRQTIDTTKETIEWARERMPLGRKS